MAVYSYGPAELRPYIVMAIGELQADDGGPVVAVHEAAALLAVERHGHGPLSIPTYTRAAEFVQDDYTRTNTHTNAHT